MEGRQPILSFPQSPTIGQSIDGGGEEEGWRGVGHDSERRGNPGIISGIVIVICHQLFGFDLMGRRKGVNQERDTGSISHGASGLGEGVVELVIPPGLQCSCI